MFPAPGALIPPAAGAPSRLIAQQGTKSNLKVAYLAGGSGATLAERPSIGERHSRLPRRPA